MKKKARKKIATKKNPANSQAISKSPGNWRQKIAKNRGETWMKNVSEGRKKVQKFPSAIRLARISKLSNQESIAQKIGVTNSTYGEIERGIRPVSIVIASKIASILGKPVTILFKKVESNPKKLIATHPKFP